MRKKSESSKGYGYQEKKTERYYKKEAYDTRGYQEQELEQELEQPEWMTCDSNFPDFNGIHTIIIKI